MKTLTIFLLCVATVFIPQSFAKSYLSKEQKLRQFILKLESEQDQIQGGAIAILDHGRVVYKKTFGYERTKTNPITSKTLFPLASVSKAVSATAIALMVEDGELKLDEKYKLAYLHNPISIRNILGHTTGYNFSGNSEIEDGYNRTRLLKTLELQQPKCNPDSCYRYSNLTFSLIEDVLNTKNLSLHYAIEKLCTALNTKGIQIEPLAPGASVAYPHAMRKTKRNILFKAFGSFRLKLSSIS
jgi:beta-lactamase class C